MKIFGSISELVKIIIRTAAGKEVRIESAAQTGTTPITITIPDVGDSADTVVMADTAQTLTNKTLTSPAISSPTGLVKGDVGLGNVDNTSDATKNSASVTLTNKTISAASNTLTNIANASISASAAIDATKIADGTVTSAEFQYINSVTSNVQTQLDAKVVKNSPITGATNTKITYDASGLVTAGASLAASDLPTGIDAAKINTGVVSNTEFNYLDGVTSAIQTQLGNKAATGANSDITSLSALSTPLSIGQGGTGQITANAAVNALLPSQTSAVNRFLRTDGSNTSWASAGGGVGKNYLQDQYDADASISVQQSVGNTLASYTRLNPTYFGSSDASLPLISVSVDGTLRPLNNYLIAFTTNAQFIETPLFSLDGIDLGKAMAVSFAVTGVGAADDVQTYIARYNSSNVLQERIPIAGIASATSPNSAQLPTGTTNFRGFFIPSSTAGDKYALRILRNATNTSMRIDALVVGPSSIQTGTAITDWQSYTPASYQGLGTPTSVEIQYRRVGDSVEVKGKLTTGTVAAAEVRVALPSSLTSAGVSVIPTIQVAGDWYRNAGSIGNGFAVLIEPSVTYFTIGQFTNSGVVLTKATGSGNLGSTEVQVFHAKIPISIYSSNVTMADRAVEEYVSNSDTSAGNNISSFAYGPAGSLIPTITASATNGSYDKTVQFNTPIQATDLLSIEIQNGGTGEWIPLVNHDRYTTGKRLDGAAKIYGINLTKSTSTQVLVCFGIYGPNLPSTWGSAGVTSYPITAGDRYRVRKVSGGAAVGYPIGARNVVGDTTGTAVPAGYIGEIQSITGQTGTFANGANITSNMTSLSLGIGTWYITAGAQASGTTMNYWRMSISSSTGAFDFNNGIQPQPPLSGGYTSIGRVSTVLNITAPTTIYLVENHWIASGTNTFTNAEIRAVRIA